MVQFRKRKSDGQAFPMGNPKKIRANNPSNDVGGLTRKGIRVPPMQSTRTEPNEELLSNAEINLYSVEWQDERDLSNIFVMRKRDQKDLFTVTEFDEAKSLTEDGFIKFFGDTEGLLNHLKEVGVIDPKTDALIDPEFDSRVEDELGSDIEEVLEKNQQFKFTKIALQDGAEYIVFANEEDAIEYGRQVISEFLKPDGGEFLEQKDVIEAGTRKDGSFDVEEALDFIIARSEAERGKSELSVIAGFVNPIDGEPSGIGDFIAFQTASKI